MTVALGELARKATALPAQDQQVLVEALVRVFAARARLPRLQ